MPVNFIQLRQQINQLGGRAQEYHQRHQNLLQKAQELLRFYADRTEKLCERVERAVQANPRLRCAKPTAGALTQVFDCTSCEPPCAVLAADGSQVNPSRHDPLPFGVVNVGAFQCIPGQPPQEITRTTLLYFDDVDTPQGLLSEGTVALRRDLFERQMLAELAGQHPAPVAALTDGPLELFFEAQESAEFRKALSQYQDSLHQLEKIKAITAGYVDKPYADLVVRLLELTELPEDDFSQAGRKRPLMGVHDSELFAGILQPGQRSAVFAIQSQQAMNFTNGLALHFFYLNTGRSSSPALARVEIPAWVAQDEQLLNTLHHTLVEQCARMGAHPYPYALHRAHEIALVSFDEKQKILDMISVEHLQRGLPVGSASQKQSNKDLSTTRTRYS